MWHFSSVDTQNTPCALLLLSCQTRLPEIREDEDNSYDDDDSNDDDAYDDYDDYDDYEYGYGNAPQSALWKDAIVIVMLLMLCYCYML